MMPEVGGLDIIRIIRRQKPDLWIVAISGNDSTVSVNMVLKLSEAYGADRIPSKPFRQAELAAVLKRDWRNRLQNVNTLSREIRVGHYSWTPPARVTIPSLIQQDD